MFCQTEAEEGETTTNLQLIVEGKNYSVDSRMAKISFLIASVREMTDDAPISLTQIKSDIFQKILDYC